MTRIDHDLLRSHRWKMYKQFVVLSSIRMDLFMPSAVIQRHLEFVNIQRYQKSGLWFFETIFHFIYSFISLLGSSFFVHPFMDI